MYNIDDAIEALTIFKKYQADKPGLGFVVGITAADHDEIWGGPDPSLVSAEDTARLEELGWKNRDDSGRFHSFV